MRASAIHRSFSLLISTTLDSFLVLPPPPHILLPFTLSAQFNFVGVAYAMYDARYTLPKARYLIHSHRFSLKLVLTHFDTLGNRYIPCSLDYALDVLITLFFLVFFCFHQRSYRAMYACVCLEFVCVCPLYTKTNLYSLIYFLKFRVDLKCVHHFVLWSCALE